MASSLPDRPIMEFEKQELIDSVIDLFELDEVERVRVQALIQTRADELGIGRRVDRMIIRYQKMYDQDKAEEKRELARRKSQIVLAMDEKGAPAVTIENFLAVMTQDPYYAQVRYNLLTNAPEIHTGGTILRWSDTDEAQSKRYIETNYHIHNDGKHFDALRLLFREREYHPICDLVDTFVWDGTPRIESFLSTWAKADDNAYVREVSRLIFAGGIWRLYRPGCKFDDVPVLIGTAQGEGKSSLVRWLALNDLYYSEVTDIEGQRGIEQLEGAWICEVAELLALTKAKEQEAVKAYITRQRDKYRKPYDRQTGEYPRRCIFIGTTNNEQFLKDKTGNRRFYPVTVHSNGYWLYEHEQECRAYIAQCWAEAKVRFDDGTFANYADQTLRDQYKKAQDDAMEDDWRVGVIGEYLSRKCFGDRVCVRQIAHEALSPNRDFPKDPSKKDAIEIAQIIKTNFPEWVKLEKAARLDGYGVQKCWEKGGIPHKKGMDDDVL